ncbi:MAG: hypothetical protein WD738_23975 [Pirellulales bacterium]
MATYQQISKRELRVSSYDRVSSWLVALLVVTGVTVAGLITIYFTRQLIEAQFGVPVTPVQAGGGGTGGSADSLGVGQDLEPPGIEEAPAFDEVPLEQTLSAVASAVSTKSALIADDSIDVGLEPEQGAAVGDSRRPGSGGGRGGGVGGGIGSGFGPGRGARAEPQREIRFEPDSLEHYAQWLDFFGIELGVLGSDNKVYYAYKLSGDTPSVRVGEPAQEQRLYMNPTDSQFAAFDRQLAAKAGIADKGRIILQFYPPETQAILYDLEQKRAGGRKPEQIRRTVFRVTAAGAKFEFSVEEQSYR